MLFEVSKGRDVYTTCLREVLIPCEGSNKICQEKGFREISKYGTGRELLAGQVIQEMSWVKLGFSDWRVSSTFELVGGSGWLSGTPAARHACRKRTE